jgi:hypothetical protein
MRAVILPDHTLARWEWGAFRAILADLDATLIGREEAHDTRTVAVTGCQVCFDQQARIMPRKDRGTFNAEQHRRKVLDVCNEYGFEVA